MLVFMVGSQRLFGQDLLTPLSSQGPAARDSLGFSEHWDENLPEGAHEQSSGPSDDRVGTQDGRQ